MTDKYTIDDITDYLEKGLRSPFDHISEEVITGILLEKGIIIIASAHNTPAVDVNEVLLLVNEIYGQAFNQGLRFAKAICEASHGDIIKRSI